MYLRFGACVLHFNVQEVSDAALKPVPGRCLEHAVQLCQPSVVANVLKVNNVPLIGRTAVMRVTTLTS